MKLDDTMRFARMSTKRSTSLIAILLHSMFAVGLVEADDEPQNLSAVEVVQQVQAGVAAVFARRSGSQNSGSGSVIDPRGYVLTAQHIVGESHVVLLGGRPPLLASVVGTMREHDMAILKLGRPAFNRPAAPEYPLIDEPMTSIRLANADDIRLGESILNIGSPGGRGIVVTRGIVSATNFIGANALALATQSSLRFDEKLQFDAASNPGNSGGPLVNLQGQQIGMVVSSIRSEEGIHFAVPISTIRTTLPKILHSELRHRFVLGIKVNPQTALTTVTNVERRSPAEDAGIRVGDRILRIDGRPLRDSIDWHFSTLEFRAGRTIELFVGRGKEEFLVSLTPAIRESRPGVASETVRPGLQCQVATYNPRIAAPLSVEDWADQPPTVVKQVTATPAGLPQSDHYKLKFQGLLKIDEAGLYRLGISSDDGSKLYVHDELLVDNDGNHSPQVRTGWVDLAAGLHPIRIEFYEDEGQQSLELFIAQGEGELTPVTPEQLCHIPIDDDQETANQSESGR